jgi:hypothetical protein
MPILLNPPHDAAFAEKAAVFRPSSKMRQRVKARLFGTCQPAVNAGQAIMSFAEGARLQRCFFRRVGHFTFNRSNPSNNESTVMIAAMR